MLVHCYWALPLKAQYLHPQQSFFTDFVAEKGIYAVEIRDSHSYSKSIRTQTIRYNEKGLAVLKADVTHYKNGTQGGNIDSLAYHYHPQGYIDSIFCFRRSNKQNDAFVLSTIGCYFRNNSGDLDSIHILSITKEQEKRFFIRDVYTYYYNDGYYILESFRGEKGAQLESRSKCFFDSNPALPYKTYWDIFLPKPQQQIYYTHYLFGDNYFKRFDYRKELPKKADTWANFNQYEWSPNNTDIINHHASHQFTDRLGHTEYNALPNYVFDEQRHLPISARFFYESASKQYPPHTVYRTYSYVYQD